MKNQGPDPALDRFRGGVAVLRRDGIVAGHLATVVEPFWGLARPFGLQERVWLLLTWAGGRRAPIEEDYPPWTIVHELRRGVLSREANGTEVEYTVEWLEGADRDALWHQVGIVDDVSSYLAGRGAIGSAG